MFPLTFTRQSHLLVGWSDKGAVGEGRGGRLLEVRAATGNHMLHTDSTQNAVIVEIEGTFCFFSASSPSLWHSTHHRRLLSAHSSFSEGGAGARLSDIRMPQRNPHIQNLFSGPHGSRVLSSLDRHIFRDDQTACWMV